MRVAMRSSAERCRLSAGCSSWMRWAQVTALTTLSNSPKTESPEVSTTRPSCCSTRAFDALMEGLDEIDGALLVLAHHAAEAVHIGHHDGRQLAPALRTFVAHGAAPSARSRSSGGICPTYICPSMTNVGVPVILRRSPSWMSPWTCACAAGASMQAAKRRRRSRPPPRASAPPACCRAAGRRAGRSSSRTAPGGRRSRPCAPSGRRRHASACAAPDCTPCRAGSGGGSGARGRDSSSPGRATVRARAGRRGRGSR